MTNSVTSQAETDETSPKRPYHALKVIPDIDQILLEGIQAGRSMLSLAKQYGVSDNAIWKRIKDHPEYKHCLETGIELRMDLREEQLESADTNVDVTRADRLLGHARWLAERTAPARFGANQRLMGADGGPIQVEIVRYGRTLDNGADATQHEEIAKIITTTPK